MPKSPNASEQFVNYLKLARLHQPVGNWLFFWPFAWGALMVAHKYSVPMKSVVGPMSIYALGSILLRSAACVWNDICDVDIDRAVERTKTRPLASGALPITGAYVYLAGLSLACMSLLFYATEQAWYQGLFGFFILNSLYPLMKRVSNWPQAWLGLAINWGFVVAWLDTHENETNMLFFICAMSSLTCWTITYDSIYACQDAVDDAKLGVKSTALLFGSRLKALISLFAAGFIVLLAIAGHLNGQGRLFYLVSVEGAALHICWQVYTLDPKNPTDCRNKFLSNTKLGAIVATGLWLDTQF